MITETDIPARGRRQRHPGPFGPGGGAADGRWGKTVLDFLLGLTLLVLATPFILVAAALVKLTSRGPAFYSQTRLGLRGRPYAIYKIRTMAHDCERLTGARWATARDPRVTPVGRVLRATHLDELPQLWNVLKGDMSLVGPRPERPEIIPKLEQALPGYRDRLRVRPGVTGLAQVQLPPDTGLESVGRKLVYDAYYIEHMTVALDVKIILSTALKMFHVPFAVSRVLLRVPGRDAVEGGAWAAPRTGAALQPEVA
jgi:lipopolysaccharide/colanic/teichoic acid biosynthesis glycosyltransferase